CDRGPWLDARRDIDGTCSRCDRGALQSVLSGDFLHHCLHHHGARAAGAPGRPVRTGGVTMRQSTLLLIGLAAAGLIAPLTGLYPLFLMKCIAFALFAAAFNFFTGYVGLLSIGHAAFFGMGAYLAGHSAKAWGLPTELALAVSLCVGGVLGLVIGGMAIR